MAKCMESSKSLKCVWLIIRGISLGIVLDIVKLPCTVWLHDLALSQVSGRGGKMVHLRQLIMSRCLLVIMYGLVNQVID